MGLFKRSPKMPTKKVGVKEKAKQVSEGSVVVAKEFSTKGSRILYTPRVSEKSAALASKGTYVFNIPLSANKVEIRKAVEGLYKVNVESVRIIRGIGKIMHRGKISGRRVNWKKALVSIKKGQTIDLYAGV
jgi:large subunit ribosomal protein L23